MENMPINPIYAFLLLVPVAMAFIGALAYLDSRLPVPEEGGIMSSNRGTGDQKKAGAAVEEQPAQAQNRKPENQTEEAKPENQPPEPNITETRKKALVRAIRRCIDAGLDDEAIAPLLMSGRKDEVASSVRAAMVKGVPAGVIAVLVGGDRTATLAWIKTIAQGDGKKAEEER